MPREKCHYCGSNLGPPVNGCLPMILCLIIGGGLVMLALKIMDGLTYGGIWK